MKAAIAAVEDAVRGDNAPAIDSATQSLSNAMQAFMEAASGAGRAEAPAQHAEHDDNVVDAEVREHRA